MPYDPSRNLFANQIATNMANPGGSLKPVVPSASVDLDKYSLLYATAPTTITYIPMLNADTGENITETVPAGWISVVVVRRVISSSAANAVFQIL
jgi:hypothetical protein